MITPIVGASITAGTAGTVPAGHQVGDYIVAVAWRDGSATAPTVDAGFRDISGSISGTLCSLRMGGKFAASSSESGGTWTNATHVSLVVLRNADQVSTTPIGGSGTANNASTTVNYPAATLKDYSGKSLLVAVAHHRAVDGTATLPVGWTSAASLQDATSTIIIGTMVKPTVNWPATDTTWNGTSSGWVTWLGEVRAARPVAQNYLFPTVTGSEMSVGEKIR